MAQEQRRGCGYRKVGGIYLVSSGIWLSCDRLPIEVGACPVCGEGIHFPRSMREVNPLKLFGLHENCNDPFVCHVCRPTESPAYLLGVGEKFYTPQSFLTEATTMGVCKRIPAVPRNFKVGETWVYLVHRKAIETGKKDNDGNHQYKMAIFAAFCPERIEMPVWKSQASKEKLEELGKRGITPVVFEDGDPDHTPHNKSREVL